MPRFWKSRNETQTAVDCASRFVRCYEQHFDFVFRNARRLGVLELHAEDVAQEVFVLVYRKMSGGEKINSEKAWLFSLLNGIVQNHRRAKRRHPELSEPPGDFVSPQDPTMTLEAREQFRTLQRILETLGEEQRVVFVLSDLEDLPAHEIAAALSLPVNTVYSRLRMARVEVERFLHREKNVAVDWASVSAAEGT